MPGIALSYSQPPEMEPMEAESPALEVKPEPPAKSKRARDEKGRLVADDPKTPANEAFESAPEN